jgi:hypothetical protein
VEQQRIDAIRQTYLDAQVPANDHVPLPAFHRCAFSHRCAFWRRDLCLRVPVCRDGSGIQKRGLSGVDKCAALWQYADDFSVEISRRLQVCARPVDPGVVSLHHSVLEAQRSLDLETCFRGLQGVREACHWQAEAQAGRDARAILDEILVAHV